MSSIRLYFKRDIIYFPIFLEKRYVRVAFVSFNKNVFLRHIENAQIWKTKLVYFVVSDI